MSVDARRCKTERQNCVVEVRAYVDGQPTIPCTMKDMTPQGAKLVAAENIASGKILMFIPAIGEVWAGLVRWRRGHTVGVRFIVGEADLITDEKPSWPEEFALRVQLAQMKKTTKRLAGLAGSSETRR